MLYAANDINLARNDDARYRDFLALVLSPPFASPDEGKLKATEREAGGGKGVVGGGNLAYA